MLRRERQGVGEVREREIKKKLQGKTKGKRRKKGVKRVRDMRRTWQK